MSDVTIRTKLKRVPAAPGVYLHKSADKKIIYVGKAAVLRNRLSQYFQPATLAAARTTYPKLAQHIGQIADIDWIETETELDALFLEAELVKRYKPKYNILLQDDKAELYVRIDDKSQYPTVTLTRRPLDDGASYFGPYFDARAIKSALRILRKVFPYDTRPAAGKKVGLDYHLGLSPGLEEGKTPLAVYRANLKYLMSYLRGNRVKLIKQLEQAMKKAAHDQDFERAAGLRNQITALRAMRKQVVFGREEFMDITKDAALNGLARLVGLAVPPRRIEGYDISHMSGTNNSASMVVFTNGVADKAEYRKFKMRLLGNDDFGHMREVITRRFSPANVKKWGLPDLVLIDGGKGQVAAAAGALADLGQEVPLLGLAKRQEKLIIPHSSELSGFSEVLLDKDSPVLKLLQRIRDESHRFALSYHSTLKRQAQTANMLEAIPGIGPQTRKTLLRHFGSIRALREATEVQIAEVIGAHKARMVLAALGERAE